MSFLGTVSNFPILADLDVSYTMYILKSRNRSVGTSCIQFESFPWLSLETQLRGIKNNICCLFIETKKRLATQILDTYHLSMSDETSTYATCQFNQEERIYQLISCTGEKQYYRLAKNALLPYLLTQFTTLFTFLQAFY